MNAMANNDNAKGREITGRKVFIIFAGAFAIIIGVNLFMAYSAIGTFPGLEVKNSYVASQTFDDERKAQEALGWEVEARFDNTDLVLDIIGPNGMAARVEEINATLGRATQRTDDQDLAFIQDLDGAHVAPVGELAPGKWELRLLATAANGVPFRQRIALYVSGN
ncbi:FixH family protein [Maritimibacter sp. HL-12]|uniref:FixH family protein n=1 Tax=Maritimibacter sp. HL-12 TaxID=1162418 RepID=UPI000A0EFBFD|nr:FixH family protein [Maritimibacter sp. HL-12]SMH40670.1 Nitrogen fixation protein FixH [Maritimibacter sp. HL-12]